MSTSQHKQVKSKKQHLQIWWGRGAEKNKYPIKVDTESYFSKITAPKS